MIYFLQFIFIVILMLRWKGSNNCYKILVMFQVVSFVTAPLVANYVTFETPLTFLNTVFCLLNLYLIITPWRRVKNFSVEIDDFGFFKFYKKILYIVLRFTVVNNLIVLIIIRFYIGDAAIFKAKLGYTALYDTIPYFGILFRYTSVSRYLGLLALPIVIYYLGKKCYKDAAKAFLLSSSTLIASLAFYSRAQLLLFIVLCVCLYFYMENIFDDRIQRIVRKVLKYVALAGLIVFFGITISRFNSPAMSYYGDRIPKDSYIKTPAVYSTFDYASKGFTNGIMQLELHEIKDVMYGEPIYYDLMLMLSYFHLTSWSKEDYAQRLADAYNKKGLNEGNNEASFHGYTCSMVKMVGYVCTFLFGLIYYRYVRRKSLQTIISVKSLSVLVFLLWISIGSIFYSDCYIIMYPLLFYLFTLIIYSLLHHRIVLKKRWLI